MNEANLFSYLWSGVLSFAGLVFGLLHAGHRREMEQVRDMAKTASDKAAAADAALAAHKVYAAETFARKAAVEKLIDRVDERFDRVDEKLDKIAEAKH